MVAALEWWSGTECTLYTDPKSYPLYGNENAIVVLNHSFEIDFLCGWTFCERFGVLGVRESVPEKYVLSLFWAAILHLLNIFIFVIWISFFFSEFKSVSQKRVGLRASYWLDVVLPRDRFLQEKLGARQKNSGSGSTEPAGLPRKFLGKFDLLVKSSWLKVKA